MDKTFSLSYSSSQITYVEAQAVEFSRFSFRLHIPGRKANTRSDRVDNLKTAMKKSRRPNHDKYNKTNMSC